MPAASKNLFYLTRLRFTCEEIGVKKITITSDKAKIYLEDKNKINPTKIINLIQKQSNQYKLAGQNTLIFLVDMAPDYTRIAAVDNLLQDLLLDNKD